MNVNDFQQQLKQFYEDNGCSEADSFLCISLLTEETGEVAKMIRELEFGPHPLNTQIAPYKTSKKLLIEKLGNILSTITFIANQQDIKLQDICEEHLKKLDKIHTMMNN